MKPRGVRPIICRCSGRTAFSAANGGFRFRLSRRLGTPKLASALPRHRPPAESHEKPGNAQNCRRKNADCAHRPVTRSRPFAGSTFIPHCANEYANQHLATIHSDRTRLAHCVPTSHLPFVYGNRNVNFDAPSSNRPIRHGSAGLVARSPIKWRSRPTSSHGQPGCRNQTSPQRGAICAPVRRSAPSIRENPSGGTERTRRFRHRPETFWLSPRTPAQHSPRIPR